MTTGSVIAVRVSPGSSRPGIEGPYGDVLPNSIRLRVASPPVDGRANTEVCEVLAAALGIDASTVRVAGGMRSRAKRIWVPLPTDEVARRLGFGGPSTSGR